METKKIYNILTSVTYYIGCEQLGELGIYSIIIYVIKEEPLFNFLVNHETAKSLGFDVGDKTNEA